MHETWNKYAPTAARSLSASARRPRAGTIDVHSHVVAAVLSLEEASMAAVSGGNARRLLSLS